MIAVQDRARIDRAIEAADMIDAVVQSVTESAQSARDAAKAADFGAATAEQARLATAADAAHTSADRIATEQARNEILSRVLVPEGAPMLWSGADNIPSGYHVADTLLGSAGLKILVLIKGASAKPSVTSDPVILPHVAQPGDIVTLSLGKATGSPAPFAEWDFTRNGVSIKADVNAQMAIKLPDHGNYVLKVRWSNTDGTVDAPDAVLRVFDSAPPPVDPPTKPANILAVITPTDAGAVIHLA